MTTTNITKGQMINEIIGIAKNAAVNSNKYFDGADLFFTLAFKSDKEIKNIYDKLSN